MRHRNRSLGYNSPPPAVPSRTCLGLHDPRVRTLLVTGHTGFVGRTVPGVLHASQDRWRLVTLPDGFDVRSRELTRHLVDLRPDAVLHLGGLTSVAESYRNPYQFFDVNFNGTWNFLKAWVKFAG